MWSDEKPTVTARLPRHYHDAVTGCASLPAEISQRPLPAGCAPCELVCHNDFAADNAVSECGAPPAIVDSGTTGPWLRTSVIASAVYRSVLR